MVLTCRLTQKNPNMTKQFVEDHFELVSMHGTKNVFFFKPGKVSSQFIVYNCDVSIGIY